MAHPPEVGDPGEATAGSWAGAASVASGHGAKALQLVGGVPVGLLALAGLDHGGDGGLVALGDRPA